ncbi:MAG: VWA domain-containing protein [Acidobacteriota bacterium]
MKRVSLFALLVLTVAVNSVVAQQAGQEQQEQQEQQGQQKGRFQFRVAVEAVNLNVVVTDRNGRFIPGLEASDFEVLEDGVRQELSLFTSEVTPLTVLLLLDASTSIRPSVEGIKEAAANFVRKLWDGDQAIVGDFNERIRFSSYFTDDVDRLIASIQSLYPSGWTALYDSILISIAKVSGADGRKALLVFTDGDDSRSLGQGSEATKDDAVEGAKLSEVTIYAVGFRGRRAAGRRGVNKGFLNRLARETGGSAFFPKNIGELNRDFAQIQEELHSQYRMAYVPKNMKKDGRWRRIEVRIRGRGDLVVRTRQGYYALPEDRPSM